MPEERRLPQYGKDRVEMFRLLYSWAAHQPTELLSNRKAYGTLHLRALTSEENDHLYMTQTVARLTTSLNGLPCWDVQWERYTNLSFRFGNPKLSVREPRDISTVSPSLSRRHRYRTVMIKGEWLFWVYYAYWHLTLPDMPRVTRTTKYRKMQQSLVRLEGQIITDITINPTNGATIVRFDLGAILSIRRIDSISDIPMWSLYAPNEMVLSIRGGGQMSYQKADTPYAEETWESLSSQKPSS